MTEPARRSTSLWRRFIAFHNLRLSESILLSGVFLIGLLILAIHLATWGREVRRDSKKLMETVCVVQGLVVRARADDSGHTRYRPELKIHYDYAGESYDAWAFDRTTLTEDQGFFYSLEEAKSIAESYKKGGTYRCWIRVDEPSQAILVKNKTLWGWIFLIIPASLILFAGALLVARAREKARSKEERASRKRQETLYPNVPAFDGETGEVLAKRLRPDVKSSWSFACSAFGALAWNVASWIAFLYVIVTSKTAADYWYAALFGALFCGVGVLFTCRLWGLYRIERVVGATVLEISTSPIVPGRKVKACLFLRGRVEAKRLDVFVKCDEIARYVQGTNSICQRHEIFSRPVYTQYALDVPAKSEEQARFTFALPIGVAHSFVAEHNEIEWKIVVQMEFADGGVFTRDFAIVVHPFLGERDSGR